MTIKLSNRSKNVSQSEIRAMSLASLEYSGINLSQGVCDTKTPDPVLNGATKAIEAGDNTYTRLDGINRLRTSIANKEMKLKGVKVDPNSEICVSSGATGALYSALLATLNIGDEVIVFEPYYGYHISTLNTMNIGIKYVRLTPPNWEFTREMIEEQITDKTKAIIINTPGNPSGKVFNKSELELIGEIIDENDLILFSDEIYEYFVYGDKKHISPISIPSMRERTIVIGGFSKTFSITGWRVGYTLAPKNVTEAIGSMSDLVYICAPAPLQVGVAEGIDNLGEEHYRELCEDHFNKRELICSALRDAGFNPLVPNGSYYVLADISNVDGETSREKAMTFLKESGVAGVPGSAFYHDNSGDNLIRFCYAKELDVIVEACDRIRKFGESCQKQN